MDSSAFNRETRIPGRCPGSINQITTKIGKCLDQKITNKAALYNGDSCQVIKSIPDESIDFTIYSPPFSSLYTYSNQIEDLGNSTKEEFIDQYKYLMKDIFRITKPGRLQSIHCMNLPTLKQFDGYIGLQDFRGDIIRLCREIGWIFHSEVSIFKCPVQQVTRTKALGLLHKQIKKDSSMCRQGLADYLVTFRKPGENKEPITHTNESYPVYKWQNTASPTYVINDNPLELGYIERQQFFQALWDNIRVGDVLKYREGKDEEDQKHICFAEGTLVLTKRGYVPIESVIVNEDYTLTHTGSWKKIVAKLRTQENANVIQTKASGVPNLISTPDHKLWARASNGSKPKDGARKNSPEWTEAKDCLGHFLNQKLPPIIESSISKDEMWIIGRWLADGHVDVRGRQFFISVGSHKIEEFEKRAKNYIGAKNEKENCYQIGLKNLSKETREVLFKCGRHAYEKMLPIELISLNQEMAEELLSGYISGDGHLDKWGRYHFTSVSRSLLLGMSLVVQRARSLVASIYNGRRAGKKTIHGRVVNTKQEWIMVVAKRSTHSLLLNDGAWKRVKSVKDAGRADVWSIQVEGDASYTAEGCIVKNCPLQLEVIRRALDLWTNPNDIVFSPFLGIGSEGYCSLERGRRFVGIELKSSYFRQAVKNLDSVPFYSLENDLKPYKEIDDAAKVAKDPKKQAARAKKDPKFKAEQLEMF